jgi:Glycerophosphoryl diester phosphodiesterase family
MHRLAPKWPLVALTNHEFLQVGQPGASPWLGGVDADNYGGDFVKTAATAIPGLTALSPNYGFPQNGKVGDPGFRFYPDQAMVSEAHDRGLKVIPWTCDDAATVEALMDLGVDGIITNYPNLVRQIMADRGMRLPKATSRADPLGARRTAPAKQGPSVFKSHRDLTVPDRAGASGYPRCRPGRGDPANSLPTLPARRESYHSLRKSLRLHVRIPVARS